METREAIRQKDREVGKLLKAIRASRGLSLKQLAYLLDVSYQQLQKYETAQNRISAGALCYLIESLNLPLECLPVEPRIPPGFDLETCLLTERVIDKIGKENFKTLLQIISQDD